MPCPSLCVHSHHGPSLQLLVQPQPAALQQHLKGCPWLPLQQAATLPLCKCNTQTICCLTVGCVCWWFVQQGQSRQRCGHHVQHASRRLLMTSSDSRAKAVTGNTQASSC